MDNKKREILAIVAIIIFVLLVIAGVVSYNNIYLPHKTEQERVAAESELAEQELIEKYIKQNLAFNLGQERDTYRGNEHTEESKNYLLTKLAYYEHTANKTVTIEEAQEYLSEEFEPDGSIRIYDNGNWRNIQEYVEWYADNQDAWGTFKDELYYTLLGLRNKYPQLSEYRIPTLSFENLDELIRVHFDSNYEPQFIFDGEITEPVFPTSEV